MVPFCGRRAVPVRGWLAALFGTLLGTEAFEYPGYGHSQATWVENSALLSFLVLALCLVTLSYFVARRHNWARLVLVGVLLFCAIVVVVLLLARAFTGRLRTADEIGEFVVGVGFLFLPTTAAAFLLNKPVAEEFVARSQGATSSPTSSSGPGAD
jgi:hypothetical protein